MARTLEFIGNHTWLFLALAAIVALIIREEIGRVTRGFQEVDPLQATRLFNHNDAILLDVREPKELSTGTIYGAKHIPLSLLAAQLEQIKAPKDQPIIAYCRNGHRSGRACAILKKGGFDQVYHLKGGMSGWQQANLPTSRNSHREA